MSEFYVLIVCHVAIEGTFVGKSLLGEAFVELYIDVVEMTPELQEPFLEF